MEELETTIKALKPKKISRLRRD